MKFRVAFKTPDVLDMAATSAAANRFQEIRGLIPHRAEDIDDLIGELKEKYMDLASKWVKFNEYVTIEFDTHAGTATVVPVTK